MLIMQMMKDAFPSHGCCGLHFVNILKAELKKIERGRRVCNLSDSQESFKDNCVNVTITEENTGLICLLIDILQP